jgi:2'-5' RNA ligase
VLGCAAQSEQHLRSFQCELGQALHAAGLGEHLEKRPYVPHLTIAYAEDVLAQPIAISPIVWKAGAFALMDSLVGQSTHAEIEHWPLRE